MKVKGVSEGKILAAMRRSLSPARFRHSVGVARWAEKLAIIHGEDRFRARLAGLLHDCAKELGEGQLVLEVRRRRIAVPGRAFILANKRYSLFHAHVSAWVAQTKFGVADRLVLNAIARHTLGHHRMSLLDKILYIADFSSPDRRFSSAGKLRQLARQNLEEAFRETLRLKITYVAESHHPLHPQTLLLWKRGLLKGGTKKRLSL